MDCTLNMAVVTFLLQHLFDDEECNPPPPNKKIEKDVSTVQVVIVIKCGKVGRGSEYLHLTPSNIMERRQPQSGFGFWVIKMNNQKLDYNYSRQKCKQSWFEGRFDGL